MSRREFSETVVTASRRRGHPGLHAGEARTSGAASAAGAATVRRPARARGRWRSGGGRWRRWAARPGSAAAAPSRGTGCRGRRRTPPARGSRCRAARRLKVIGSGKPAVHMVAHSATSIQSRNSDGPGRAERVGLAVEVQARQPGERHAVVQLGVGLAAEHLDAVPELGQLAGQRPDVDALAAAVRLAPVGQQCDAQRPSHAPDSNERARRARLPAGNAALVRAAGRAPGRVRRHDPSCRGLHLVRRTPTRSSRAAAVAGAAPAARRTSAG